MRQFSEKHKKKLSERQKCRLIEGRNPTAFKKGHIPTLEMRLKMGSKGEKHFRWKGGITKNNAIYRKLLRERNIEKTREYFRRWKKRNKEKVRVWGTNDHLRRKNIPGSFNLEEWEEVKKQYGYRCAICKKDTKLTIDHITPVSKGGTNFIENIQPLCLSCNCSKHDLTYEEFIEKSIKIYKVLCLQTSISKTGEWSWRITNHNLIPKEYLLPIPCWQKIEEVVKEYGLLAEQIVGGIKVFKR